MRGIAGEALDASADHAGEGPPARVDSAAVDNPPTIFMFFPRLSGRCLFLCMVPQPDFLSAEPFARDGDSHPGGSGPKVKGPTTWPRAMAQVLLGCAPKEVALGYRGPGRCCL